jgi:hypothetical protein
MNQGWLNGFLWLDEKEEKNECRCIAPISGNAKRAVVKVRKVKRSALLVERSTDVFDPVTISRVNPRQLVTESEWFGMRNLNTFKLEGMCVTFKMDAAQHLLQHNYYTTMK